MGVTLYTSRVILHALGVSDYGIYNIVGGVVAMFGFINGAMASSTQRYLSFDIGKGDLEALKKTFSASLTVHLMIAVFVVIIGESIGLWYINYKMVFPVERLLAVNVVYQFSLMTLFLDIVQVPYNALILARERMNVYAYVSIFEAFLKLSVALSLLYFGFDKLILYSILTFFVAFIVRLSYQVYCKKNFQESKYKFEYDPNYLRELISYSGWNLFGALSLVGKNQGVNIVLNLFFGTVINAAFGIAMQVQAAVTQFVSNFQSALNPQIIQNYASNNKERFLNLMFLGAKFSFFVMQFLAVPLILHLNIVLQFWLGHNVPDSTSIFLRISLIMLLIDSISGPLTTGVLAVGKLKSYQLYIGGMNLFVPLVVYILMSYGMDAYYAFIVLVVFSIFSMLLRVYFLRKYLEFRIYLIIREVFFPIILTCLSGALLVFIIDKVINVNNGVDLCIWTFFYVLFQSMAVFFLGLNNNERQQLLSIFRKRINTK